jgi:hypothetical protein
MASEGPLNGSSAAQYSNPIGSQNWSNLSGILTASDSSVATTGSFGNDGSRTHIAGATNFGFAIPSGATIDGIEVKIRASASFADRLMLGGYLIKGGTLQPNTASAYSEHMLSSTSLTDYTYGGATDLWGTTWSTSDVNASNFGAGGMSRGIGFGSASVSIDHISITVYYTGGGPTQYSQTISTSAASSVLIPRAISTSRTVTSSPVASLSTLKAIKRAISTSVGTVASTFKSASRRITVTPSASAFLSRSYAVSVQLATSATALPTLQTIRFIGRVLSTNVSSIPFLRKGTRRRVSTSVQANPAVRKLVSSFRRATAPISVVLEPLLGGEVYEQLLTATASASASVSRGFRKALSALVNTIPFLDLLEDIIPKFPGFVDLDDSSSTVNLSEELVYSVEVDDQLP